MNRRTFIQLGLTASAGTLLSPKSITGKKRPARAKAKRGLAIVTRKDPKWSQKVGALDLRWFYSWSASVPEDIPPGIEFVPMIPERTIDEKIEMAADIFRGGNFKNLLGFNEPDKKDQANLSVEDALVLWPKLMAMGLRLGSPACSKADHGWMKSFMQGVIDRSLRVDFVAVHHYSDDLDAARFMADLEAVYKLYNRPLWITEFGVADWNARMPSENRYEPAQIIKFLDQVLPQLERSKFVERYAWFSPKKSHPALGPCALFDDDGSFTELGNAYRSL